MNKNYVNYLIKKVKTLKLESKVVTAIDDNWENILLEEQNEYYKWDYISLISKIISEYYF